MGKTPPTSAQWPSRLGMQNTQTASLQRGKTPHLNECSVAQSAYATEYTDYISTEDLGFPNECHVTQSAGAAEYTNCISAAG